LEEVTNKEFERGRTHNLGIASRDGNYVALLTQDALPADHHWFARLIGGFAVSARVGGVIGRLKAYPEHCQAVPKSLL